MTTTERRAGPADVARMLTMGASGITVFALVAYLGATDGAGESPDSTVPAGSLAPAPTVAPGTVAPATAVALTTLVPTPPSTMGPTLPAPTAPTTPVLPPPVDVVSEQSG